MALPPSNWFFMIGLLERFSCRVCYLTPERASPGEYQLSSSAIRQPWRVGFYRAVEKLSESFDLAQSLPEFIEGTNGQVLIFPFTIFNSKFTSDIEAASLTPG